MTPGGAATIGAPRSLALLKSTARELGLWVGRLVPVQVSPHGNGISKSGPDVPAALADPGSPATSAPPRAPATTRGRSHGRRRSPACTRAGIASPPESSVTGATETPKALKRNALRR